MQAIFNLNLSNLKNLMNLQAIFKADHWPVNSLFKHETHNSIILFKASVMKETFRP